MKYLLSLLGLLYLGLAHAADKPNVVVFLIDDLGYRDLGCYGSSYYKTPNVDRLAREGVRFTQGYAICPVCSPTRAGLLTGQHPARLGLTNWLPGMKVQPQHRLLQPESDQQLTTKAATLSEMLSRAGYTCGHIGKWHLGGKGALPTDRGFENNIGGDENGTPKSYFAPFASGGQSMPGLEKAAEGEYLTDRLAQEAVKWIGEKKDKPFFLYLPHFAVHTPLVGKKDLIAKYKPGNLGSQGNPTYAAMVESMDSAVGSVLAALEQHKLTSNTLIIFTSDNGGEAMNGRPLPPTYNGPMREGKGWLYEGGIRVPLIIKAPGVSPTVCDVPATSLDIVPTVLEYCGLTAPALADGRSLKGILGGDRPTREAFYWHYPHYSPQGGRPSGAIRSGDYKLLEFYETGRKELFNLKKDVSESRNLAMEQPEVVKQLAGELDQWRKSVGARTNSPNPNYHPNVQTEGGTVVLHSRTALVEGVMLRYEPLPHKNTLGFWVRKEDTARFEFELKTTGDFEVEVLQGCGRGSGGSEVEISVGDSRLTFTVKDTGGFQAFEPRKVGYLKIKTPGRHVLNVIPKTKPGVAVMDLREIKLQEVILP